MKKFPIEDILGLLGKEEDFVFLESARRDADNFLSYLFLRPKQIISTFRIDEIEDCLAKLNRALKEGYYTAGFISYEAGEAFEERLRKRKAYAFPLLWFGVYERPLIYDHRRQNFTTRSTPGLTQSGSVTQSGKYALKDIRPNISQDSYEKAVAKVKDLIARGLTYQVNYTFKLKFSFSGSASGLYLNLRNNQNVSYAAFIKANHNYILSFSPELFFKKRAEEISTRPMKGTAGRGRTVKEDSRIAQRLKACPKNRSENLMIVDLLRNDLGRISATGSVKVARLFNVERYQTLFQMTSDIKSRLKERRLAFEVFSHIFPSGSVTGAPKIKTMQIIRKLEKGPRNVYTGSIGFFSPANLGTFNVAIRTLLIDTKNKKGEMGVGSGIVYDSDAKSEYAECCLKADFLTKKTKQFRIIETIAWRPDKGFLLLNEHLRRLENSARYFDFVFNKDTILTALARLEKYFEKRPYRLRLLLDKGSNIEFEPSLLEWVRAAEPKVYLSGKKRHSQDPFLYHKTTNRKAYDEEYKRARSAGYFDAIFTNERDEITEGAISNVFIRKNGTFYTPPKSCGLLGGLYRKYLLNSQDKTVEEKVLFKEDLLGAEEIYLTNSVRGLVKVRLESKSH